jgi:ubiquinone/menaquinone biosynthesis C-methylase UbiE
MPDEPLYGKAEARALRAREEAKWASETAEKCAAIEPYLAGCRRLVDIGCGWGQFLRFAVQHVPEVWGVDESADRMDDCRESCPQARLVQCRADALDLPDDHFDVVTASQMMHEVELFGQPGELHRTLSEVRRVLAPGGRFLLLDHADAGDGSVVVEMPQQLLAHLVEFEAKYEFRSVIHEEISPGVVRVSKRDLQDLLTKIWAFDTDMEPMEMEETHNVFRREELEQAAREAGLEPEAWTRFTDLGAELAGFGGRFVEGGPWLRKFMMVASRPED